MVTAKQRWYAIVFGMLLVVGLGSGCQGKSVVVTLRSVKQQGVTLEDGVTSDVKRVRVTATVSGQRSRIEKVPEADVAKGSFAIALPSGASGTLALDVEGADGTGLVVASGQAQLVLDGTDGQPVKVGIAPCNHADMCWKSPGPQGGNLEGIWPISATDVWAVGSPQTVIHWDGTLWAPALSFPNTDNVNSVWASGKDDVWFGGSTLTRFDGTSFSIHPEVSGRVTAIHGLNKSDIWAVTAGGTGGGIWHYDGTAWKSVLQLTSPNGFNDVWATGPNNAWVIGNDNAPMNNHALIYRCKNLDCKTDGKTVIKDYAIKTWGISDDTAWIAGVSASFQWTGNAWVENTPPPVPATGSTKSRFFRRICGRS